MALSLWVRLNNRYLWIGLDVSCENPDWIGLDWVLEFMDRIDSAKMDHVQLWADSSTLSGILALALNECSSFTIASSPSMTLICSGVTPSPCKKAQIPSISTSCRHVVPETCISTLKVRPTCRSYSMSSTRTPWQFFKKRLKTHLCHWITWNFFLLLSIITPRRQHTVTYKRH